MKNLNVIKKIKIFVSKTFEFFCDNILLHAMLKSK